MISCEHLRRQALALAALAAGEWEREEAWEHARTCAGCAQALREGERMLALVDAELVPSPPSADALLRASRAVQEQMERGAPHARSPRAARMSASLATISAGVVLAGLPAHHALDASSVAVAGGAAGMAAALAWLGVGRRAAGAALAACLVSIVFSALAAASPGLFADAGVHCLALELFAAAWPLAAVAVAGGLSSPASGWTTAALASAGALAAQAALHLDCPVSSAGAHLFVFHLGGVALAALAGWVVPRVARLSA
jgi:hypothetical protein